MNARERFLASMEFERVPPPMMEWDYWPETIRKWHEQGAPVRPELFAGINATAEDSAFNPFSMDLFPSPPFIPGEPLGFTLAPATKRVPVNSFIHPLFEYRILEEHGDVVIAQDERGHIRKEKKTRDSIFQILKPLVTNRADWERVKEERLQVNVEGRFPADWPQIREQLKNRDFVLAIGGHSGLCGFFHPVRYLFGPEGVMYAFHDDPALVHDIMDHLLKLQMFLFDRILSEIKVDFCFACEDLGFKTSTFISPATFREFLLPRYKKFTAMLRDHGVRHFIVDSDGYNWKMIPLFLEGGATGMGPMEVAAGMDVVEVRKAFPRLQILGGLDKRELAAGQEAIDKELTRRLASITTGGYIPLYDHSVAPDFCWNDFRYYRKSMEERIAALYAA